MMDASIEVTCGPGSTLEGSRFSFATCPVSLGRQPGNDIVFDAENDRVVSGHHAELRFEGDAIRLHDLDSSNGTFVNGIRVEEPVTLSFGDRIVLGHGGATLQVYSPLMPRPTSPTSRESGTSNTGARSTRSTSEPSGQPGHDTIVAMISHVAAQERHRSRSLVICLTIAIAIVGAGLIAGAVWLFQGGAQDAMEDVARREAKIAARVQAADTARGISISIDARIKEANRGFREVFPQIEKSVYPVFRRSMIGGAERTLAGGGTCWVVAPGVLATNAHVANNHRPGTTRLVVKVGESARDLVIERVEIHPGYGLWSRLQAEYRLIDSAKLGFMRLIPACDVALMWCKKEDAKYLGPPLRIAPTTRLHALDRGTPAAFLGFPVEGTIVGMLERSEAASEIGTISQVFDYFLENNESGLEQLVTYNLKGEGGASGSPVFDRNGEVIAVHSAGNFKFIGGQRISQGSTNFGQRADLVRELLDGKTDARVRELEVRWRERFLDLWGKVRDSSAAISALRASRSWPSKSRVTKRLIKRGSIGPGQKTTVTCNVNSGASWSIAVMVTGTEFAKLGLRGSVRAPAQSWVAMGRGFRTGAQRVEVYRSSQGTRPVNFELWLLSTR